MNNNLLCLPAYLNPCEIIAEYLSLTALTGATYTFKVLTGYQL